MWVASRCPPLVLGHGAAMIRGTVPGGAPFRDLREVMGYPQDTDAVTFGVGAWIQRAALRPPIAPGLRIRGELGLHAAGDHDAFHLVGLGVEDRTAGCPRKDVEVREEKVARTASPHPGDAVLHRVSARVPQRVEGDSDAEGPTAPNSKRLPPRHVPVQTENGEVVLRGLGVAETLDLDRPVDGAAGNRGEGGG